MSKELFDAVQMLAQEKGIPEDYLYEKISAAIVVAAKHDYNGKDIVHCDIDPEKQRFKVYVTKNVVEEVEDPDTRSDFGRGPGHQEERQGGQDH